MFHKIFTPLKNNYCLLETVLLLSAARDTVFHFGKVFLSDQLFWFHLKFHPNFFRKHALWFCAGISFYRQASQLAEMEDPWRSSCTPAPPLWLWLFSSALHFKSYFWKTAGTVRGCLWHPFCVLPSLAQPAPLFGFSTLPCLLPHPTASPACPTLMPLTPDSPADMNCWFTCTTVVLESILSSPQTARIFT